MSNNEIDLLQQFIRLEWLLHRYHLQNHRTHGPMADTHRGQGRVLALLKLKPEISQKELSDILDIRSQSLGELLGKLERNGYITRTPSPADRRIMDIRLTDEGRKASDQQEPQDTDGLFGCLNDEEQTTLSDYLNRVITALEQQFGDSDSGPDFRSRMAFAGRGFGGVRPPFDVRGMGWDPRGDERGPRFDNRGFSRRPGEAERPDDLSKE